MNKYYYYYYRPRRNRGILPRRNAEMRSEIRLLTKTVIAASARVLHIRTHVYGDVRMKVVRGSQQLVVALCRALGLQ